MKKIEVSFKEDDESDEAPLIVNVTDERPEEVKVNEMYSSKYWEKLDSSIKVKSEKLTESTEKCNSTSNFSLINGIEAERRDSSEDDLSPLRRSSVKLSSDGLQKSPRYQNMPIVRCDSDLSPPRVKSIATSDSDLSPPRSKNLRRVKNIATSNSDLSPLRSKNLCRVKNIDTSDSDLSPPRSKILRRVKNIDTSDSDFSPPRIKIHDHHHIQGDNSSPTSKVKNHRHKEDFSPPTYKGEDHYKKRGSSHSRSINKTDDQCNVKKNSSPPRSKAKDQHIKVRDFSPHRRKAEKWCYKQKDISLSNRKTERNSKYSPDSFRKSRSQMQHSSDSDFSPPQERRCDDNEKMQAKHMESCKPSQYSSPLEKQHSKRKKKRHDSDSDNRFSSDKHYGTKRKNVKQLSKRMKKRHDSDSDNGFSSVKEQNSAKRKNVSYLHHANSQSPMPKSKPYRTEEESLQEPHTSSDSGVKKKHSKSTLSGMKAGLQDSASLTEEIRNFKYREKKALDVLDDELSGHNAKTVFRDKDSGQKRNLKEERLEQKEKAEKLEKYFEWGKGPECQKRQKDGSPDVAGAESMPLRDRTPETCQYESIIEQWKMCLSPYERCIIDDLFQFRNCVAPTSAGEKENKLCALLSVITITKNNTQKLCRPSVLIVTRNKLRAGRIISEITNLKNNKNNCVEVVLWCGEKLKTHKKEPYIAVGSLEVVNRYFGKSQNLADNIALVIFIQTEQLLSMTKEAEFVCSHLPSTEQCLYLFLVTCGKELKHSRFSELGVSPPHIISVPEEDLPTRCEKEFYVICPSRIKHIVLKETLQKSTGKVIVFFSSKASVKFYHALMKIDNIPVYSAGTSHGPNSGYQNFIDSDRGILFCTCATARPHFVPDLKIIIHFDPPSTVKFIVRRAMSTGPVEISIKGSIFVLFRVVQAHRYDRQLYEAQNERLCGRNAGISVIFIRPEEHQFKDEYGVTSPNLHLKQLVAEIKKNFKDFQCDMMKALSNRTIEVLGSRAFSKWKSNYHASHLRCKNRIKLNMDEVAQSFLQKLRSKH